MSDKKITVPVYEPLVSGVWAAVMFASLTANILIPLAWPEFNKTFAWVNGTLALILGFLFWYASHRLASACTEKEVLYKSLIYLGKLEGTLSPDDCLKEEQGHDK